MARFRIAQLHLRLKGIDPVLVRPTLDLLPGRIAAELRGGAGGGDRRREITAHVAPEFLASEIARQVGQQCRGRIAGEER